VSDNAKYDNQPLLYASLARTGHSHTRWLSPDGVLQRSFVQVHGEASLAREVRRAGFQVGTWEAGHAFLRRRARDGA
jgi:hypothetical protein